MLRYGSFQKANNEGADQNALMCRLVCPFVGRKSPKTGFLASVPIYSLKLNVYSTPLPPPPAVRNAVGKSLPPFHGSQIIILTIDIDLILEPWHEISNNKVCATSKGSDQPAHTRRLIRAFASPLTIL